MKKGETEVDNKEIHFYDVRYKDKYDAAEWEDMSFIT